MHDLGAPGGAQCLNCGATFDELASITPALGPDGPDDAPLPGVTRYLYCLIWALDVPDGIDPDDVLCDLSQELGDDRNVAGFGPFLAPADGRDEDDLDVSVTAAGRHLRRPRIEH
jgi:hypothetical protein